MTSWGPCSPIFLSDKSQYRDSRGGEEWQSNQWMSLLAMCWDRALRNRISPLCTVHTSPININGSSVHTSIEQAGEYNASSFLNLRNSTPFHISWTRQETANFPCNMWMNSWNTGIFHMYLFSQGEKMQFKQFSCGYAAYTKQFSFAQWLWCLRNKGCVTLN